MDIQNNEIYYDIIPLEERRQLAQLVQSKLLIRIISEDVTSAYMVLTLKWSDCAVNKWWCHFALPLLMVCRYICSVQFSSALSHVRLFATPWIAARQAPRASPTPGVHSNSCASSQWCHPAISSSVVPFSSCPQSLPASGSFPMSQLFAWGCQSTGVSASASVLSMNIQDWSPLVCTGWI